MRLWSIHPGQLDHVALVAVWREGLLAKKVLEGNTKGYTSHPQLDRFKAAEDSLTAINSYLHTVANEADRRGYKFDRTKLSTLKPAKAIKVTDGQLAYEWQHLLKKSETRTPNHYAIISDSLPRPHPLFIVIGGQIEPWERF